LKVIKLGGSLLDDAARRTDALRAIVALWNAGEELVLVHGGGKHIDAALAKLGIAKKTHAGLRITDAATLDVVVSVLGGTVNKMLVAELTKLGVRAAGVSGCDDATIAAVQHPPIDGVEMGHVGQVTASNPALVKAMLAAGIMPVVSSIAQGPDGTILNVNADSGAAAVAVALRATSLQFITDVAGLLDADGNVVSKLRLDAAEELMGTNVISGGMRPKLQAALHALRAGVGAIEIGENGGTQLVAA
jgi:acetylglutamate kinase